VIYNLDFLNELKRRSNDVNTALDRYLPEVSAYPGVIYEAMRHSVFAGGKRLRPVLALAASEVLDGSPDDIIPAACALELIHTYSLIHDDLPAMDNDDLRRGQPTCHKKFGEAIAILAGDALLTLAFNLITRCARVGSVTSDGLLTVVAEISEAAGVYGLVGGQVLDIISSSENIDAESLEYIHRNKTGAMYRASLRTGAILSGAGGKDRQSLTQYAEHLGMAFQITDDILDLLGDEKTIGKPVKSDIKNNKATYPALFGLNEARRMAADEAENSIRCVSQYGEKADFLIELVKFVIQRSY